jgi:imidazolonepropionase-like amidohydrolase
MTWFANANVVDVLTGGVHRGAAIETALDGTIVQITSRAPADADAYDIGGRWLLPGLISCHTHLSIVFPFGDTDENENPALTAYRAATRASDALRAGITTVRSVHEQNRADLLLRTGEREFYEAALAELAAGADHIKIFINGGLASAGEHYENPEMSDGEIRGAVRAATEHDTYVVAHSGESRAIRQALAQGVRCFEHAYRLDDETAELLARPGIFVTPTLCVTHTEQWMRDRGFESRSPPTP